MSPALVPAHFSSARGFPPNQVVPATIVTLLGTAVVLGLALRYRRGRLPWLDRVAEAAGRKNGLPPWAALPARIAAPSLIVAAFGFYWDVAWHIDRGRDDGPFSTPAHYPIVIGLAGLALAGLLAVVLEHDPEAPVKLPFGLRSSVGGALVLLCGSVALLGFPLDDVWHTLFGQDVTLWSPTHIQLIGGASLATIALWLLLEEGRRRGNADPRPDRPVHVLRDLNRVDVRIAGATLIGLSTLQAEYDYGVPQFAPICQPVLIGLAAGLGLVAARLRLGRWGALAAAVSFDVSRLAMAVVVGPVLGRSFLHFPLYLVEALLVEGVALALPRLSPGRFAALCGLLIGTVGYAAEALWTQVAMPLPWTSALLPRGPVLTTLAAVSGSLIGAALASVLAGEERVRRTWPTRGLAPAWAAPVGVAGGALALALVVPVHSHPGVTARLALRPTTAAGQPAVDVVATIDPPSAVRDTAWAGVLAWQGGDGTWHSRHVGQVVGRLHQVGPAQWAADRPVPVGGKWKSFLRLADAQHIEAVPIALPADPAIPAAAVPATDGVVRSFVMDQRLLQREATGGSPAVKRGAYLALGLVALVWIAAMGFGARRLGRVPVPRDALPAAPAASPVEVRA